MLLVLSPMHQENAERLGVYLRWNILMLCSSTVTHIGYFYYLFTRSQTNCTVVKINLVVGDYFKPKAEALEFTDEVSELIPWLWSGTLILALLREVQAALPGGTGGIKAIIHAVLTQWTMHY